jgi:hypothetical protein
MGQRALRTSGSGLDSDLWHLEQKKESASGRDSHPGQAGRNIRESKSPPSRQQRPGRRPGSPFLAGLFGRIVEMGSRGSFMVSVQRNGIQKARILPAETVLNRSYMATRKRKGMWIKNTHVKPVRIEMATRTVQLSSGEQLLVSAEEVLDATLRAYLQVRAISIVRPSTDDEEEGLRAELSGAGPTVALPEAHIADPPDAPEEN